MRRLIAAPLLLILSCSQTFAQRQNPATGKAKAPATQKATGSKQDAHPFAAPVEVRIGYHRVTRPAMFLTLKNLGSKLSIKSADVAVFVADPIKLKILKTYSQKFDFAVPIKPGQVGESVATSEEGFAVSDSDLVPAKCKDYTAAKDDPTRFIPDACIQGQDVLMVLIVAVDYTDGSRWVTPKLTEDK